MSTHTRAHALHLHRRLPEEIWELLRDLGIPDSVVHERLIGWGGRRVAVPLITRDRRVSGFEYLAVSERGVLEVVEETAPGRRPFLYGEQALSSKPQHAVLAQGVVEALVLAGVGFTALAATGDGLCFRDEWIAPLSKIGELAVCLKRSEESVKAGLYLSSVLADARLVMLPPAVGIGGGVAEFLADVGTADDLRQLLNASSESHA
jgi:hypothetical protein